MLIHYEELSLSSTLVHSLSMLLRKILVSNLFLGLEYDSQDDPESSSTTEELTDNLSKSSLDLLKCINLVGHDRG